MLGRRQCLPISLRSDLGADLLQRPNARRQREPVAVDDAHGAGYSLRSLRR